MFLRYKKIELPTAETALPGRDTATPVAATEHTDAGQVVHDDLAKINYAQPLKAPEGRRDDQRQF